VRWLPSFYLLVAAGGAIGGIFVNLLAPFIFSTGFWELQWAVVLVGVLLAIILQSEHRPALPKGPTQRRGQVERPSRIRPAAAGLGLVVLLLAGFCALYMVSLNATVLLARRNFYGILRVWRNEGFRPEVGTISLTHGSTVHGFQFINNDLRLLPTTFYAETSGIGLAFANHPARPGPLRVGALGEGIGVIAAYGQPGDEFRF
jgi:hypothetical protein